MEIKQLSFPFGLRESLSNRLIGHYPIISKTKLFEEIRGLVRNFYKFGGAYYSLHAASEAIEAYIDYKNVSAPFEVDMLDADDVLYNIILKRVRAWRGNPK